MLTEEMLVEIIDEAKAAAEKAATDYFNNKLGGVDQYACGFAWVNIYSFAGEKIKGNSKLGRALKKVGVRQDYTRTFQIWNPSGLHCQNVDAKYAGAQAAAEVFESYGFSAYAGERLD